MENTIKNSKNNDVSYGNVYVMTHSFFSDVVKIGCTPNDTDEYAEQISQNTPGEYKVVFSLKCINPCKVKKQIRKYLNAQEYVNEFYQVPAEVAKNLLKTETLRIPTLSAN